MLENYNILELLLTTDKRFPEVDNGIRFKKHLFLVENPKGPVKKLHEFHATCRVLDPRVNGIDVGKTVVRVDGKKGVVQRLVAGVDSFAVKFADKTRCMTLSDVRHSADPGQGVISEEDDKRKFTIFLMSIYFSTYVHVANSIMSDNQRQSNNDKEVMAEVNTVEELEVCQTVRLARVAGDSDREDRPSVSNRGA